MKKNRLNNVIMKFGGTSVGSPEAIKRLISIVSSSKVPVAGIVVSAFSDITNQLIHTANLASKGNKAYNKLFLEIADRHVGAVHELIADKSKKKETLEQVEVTLSELENILQGIFLLKETSTKILDTVMSYGELLSAYIVTQSFNDRGIRSELVDTRDLVKTDASFGIARVNMDKTYANIDVFFKAAKPTLKIITGFIGSTEKNETTTIGRGGSDYTASIFGAALQVSQVIIWTDVDGVLTADPRKVPTAFTIKQLTYQEAMEMSHFGAKVIYPQTMKPVLVHSIPLVIRNTFNPSFPGTVISQDATNGYLIKGISSIEDISLIMVQGSGLRGTPGVVARLFGTLAFRNINIILITQASSEYTICFAINPKDTQKAKNAIEEEFKHEIQDGFIDIPQVEENLSIIAVIGEQMRKTLGIPGKLFTTLGFKKVNVDAIAQGSSERNISFVVKKKDEEKALNAIHNAFFATQWPIHIYLVGTGNIGGMLLDQINSLKYIVQKEHISLQVVGIANTRKMVINKNGIDLTSWKTSFEKSGKSNMKYFIEEIIKSPLPNAIFVDCTASKELAEWYPKLLLAHVSVVTPNKIANSNTMELYQAIRKAASDAHTFFMYETNVCAGLPTLQTIQNLVATGDDIVKIEGVFSGTLSYIFNNFTGGKKFSSVVQEAQKEGYTEPDPRDDLNGLDVGRKLLIMAREVGLECELSDISIENLVPSSCRKTTSIADFYAKLSKEDPYFDRLNKKAASENKRLRYIGKIDIKKRLYTCSLTLVDAGHPFYSLSGSDNIVSITTKRYNKTPMVIKGPGAGAEVTADGVLSDIITIGKYYTYEK